MVQLIDAKGVLVPLTIVPFDHKYASSTNQNIMYPSDMVAITIGTRMIQNVCPMKRADDFITAIDSSIVEILNSIIMNDSPAITKHMIAAINKLVLL